MGGYRNEDEALIGLARQLTDAYGEARRREDQDFACDAIAEFLSEYRTSAPSEALLAILDLPLTSETYPAGGRGADHARRSRAGRRRAAAGGAPRRGVRPGRPRPRARRRDARPHGPARRRAGPRRGAVRPRRRRRQGRGRGRPGGARAVRRAGAGQDALEDPDGGEWALAALEQIRFEVAHPEALEDYAAGEGEAPDDASGLLEPELDDDEERARRRGRAGEESPKTRPPPKTAAHADDVAGDPARPRSLRRRPRPTRTWSTTPTTTSSAGTSRSRAKGPRRPNLPQRRLNTGFIIACETVHKPRTAVTVAPPTVRGIG